MAITFNHNDQVYVKDGKLGIGTDSPDSKLHIATSGQSQAAKLYQAQYQQFQFNYPATYQSSLDFGHFGKLMYEGNGGYLILRNRSSQVGSHMRFDTSDTERLRITHDGNVGIGTTSPGAKLDVNGVGTFGTGTNSQIAIGNYNDSFSGKYNIISTNNHGDFTIGSNLRVDSDRNYTTINTHNRMTGAAITFAGNGNSYDEGSIYFIAQASGSATAGTEVSKSAAKMIIKSGTGKVGIGTTNPLYKLDVAGSFRAVTSSVNLTYDNGIIYHGGSYYQFPSGSNYLLYGRSGMGLVFGSNNSEAARFDLSGNLGIGITTPSQTLDVNGTAYFRNSVGINGEGNGITVDSGYGVSGRVGLMKYQGLEGMLVAGSNTKLRLGRRTDSTTVAASGTPTIAVDIQVNTDGTIIFPQYGAGILKTNASGAISLDTSTYLTSVAFSDLTTTPTTLSGYGITDAAASSHQHSGADITSGTIGTARLDTNVARTDNTQTFTGNKTFTGSLLKTNRRVTSGEKYPLGHYTPGETVFEIDPTWTDAELKDYFGNNNVSWDEVANAPGGYAIYINGSVSVGGAYNSGFPYIPIDQDGIYYMECWIKNAGTAQGHYMGSIDYEADFTYPSSGGGNPGSYGYWVMSNYTSASDWTKVDGYITGHHPTNTGAFETDATYWTPQALFNYSAGSGTRACWISGWKVIRVDHVGDRTFQDSVFVKGKLEVHTLDANTTSTTALVMNSNEVEKRTLGSNAFNSTSIPVSGTDFDPVGTDNSTDVTLDTSSYDYLSISGQEITLGQIDYDADITNLPSIPVSGTDFDPVGTDNSTDVTLDTTSYDYLSITGQEITLGQIDYDTDITNTPTLGTAASSDATDFVAVSGDTMTGKLTIDGAGLDVDGRIALTDTNTIAGGNHIYRSANNPYYSNKRLRTYFERVITSISTATADHDKYYEIGDFAFISLEGIFDVEILFNGSGYGQGSRHRIPVSYRMDYLSNYSLRGISTYNDVWLVADGTFQSPRHKLNNASHWELQFKVVNNRIYFRIVIKGSNGQTGTATAYVKFLHSNDFDNVTYTVNTGTGTDATDYDRLPNIIAGINGKTLIQNDLIVRKVGVNTTTPAKDFHVNGTVRFEDYVSGILTVNASGDLGVDTTTYSTFSGDYADLTNPPSIPVSGTDFDPVGTDNSTDVTLNTTSYDYLSITGQEITLGQIDYDADITNLPTLGTAAATDSADYATAAQGTKADSALQSGDADLTPSWVPATDPNYLTSYTESGNITTTDDATNAFFAVPFVSTTAGSGKAVYKDANNFYYNPSTNNLQVGLLDLSDYGTAASPAIRWSGDGDTGIFSGGSNTNVIGFSTQGAEKMRLDASGNLGINVTNPLYKLDVGGTIHVRGNSGTFIRTIGSNNSDQTIIRISNGSQNDISDYGFSIKYMGTRSGNLNTLSIFSDNQNSAGQIEAITVAQNGIVGFTNASPTATVDIGGTLKASGAVTFSNYGAGLLQTDANGLISVDTSTYLTSYTETQTLDDVTTLGATTTNNISVGTLTAEDNIYLTDAGTVRGKFELNASDRDDLDIVAVSLSSNMKFFTENTERMRISSSGNVGINDTIGFAQFSSHSSQNNFAAGWIYQGNLEASGENNPVLEVGYGGGGTLAGNHQRPVLNVSSNNPNKFLATFGDATVITGDGSVGIGTTSPTSKLHVSGSVNFTETVVMSGFAPASTQLLTVGTDGTVGTAAPYTAGSGLNLSSGEFSIESDLRDGITRVGKDNDNYIAIDADNNNSIDFYISGVWVARMEADGDLHMKGDVIAFSDIFNP